MSARVTILAIIIKQKYIIYYNIIYKVFSIKMLNECSDFEPFINKKYGLVHTLYCMYVQYIIYINSTLILHDNQLINNI